MASGWPQSSSAPRFKKIKEYTVSIIEKAASRIDLKRNAPAAARTPEPAAIDAIEAAAAAAPIAPAPSESAATAAATAAPAAEQAAPRPAQKFSTRRVELDLNRMRDMGMVTAAGGRTRLLE